MRVFHPCRVCNQNNESLVDLDLSYNCIGTRGIRVLCAAVRFDAGFRHDFVQQQQPDDDDPMLQHLHPLLDPMLADALANINLFLNGFNAGDDDDDEEEEEHGGNHMVDGEQPVVALFGLDNPAAPPLVAPPLPVVPLVVSSEQLAAEMEMELAAASASVDPSVSAAAAAAAAASDAARAPLWRQHRAYHATRCRLATLDLTHAAPASAQLAARGDDEARAYETKADRRLRRALTVNQSMRSLVGVGGTPLTRVGAHAALAMGDADARLHAERHAAWIASGACLLAAVLLAECL